MGHGIGLVGSIGCRTEQLSSVVVSSDDSSLGCASACCGSSLRAQTPDSMQLYPSGHGALSTQRRVQ